MARSRAHPRIGPASKSIVVSEFKDEPPNHSLTRWWPRCPPALASSRRTTMETATAQADAIHYAHALAGRRDGRLAGRCRVGGNRSISTTRRPWRFLLVPRFAVRHGRGFRRFVPVLSHRVLRGGQWLRRRMERGLPARRRKPLDPPLGVDEDACRHGRRRRAEASADQPAAA